MSERPRYSLTKRARERRLQGGASHIHRAPSSLTGLSSTPPEPREQIRNPSSRGGEFTLFDSERILIITALLGLAAAVGTSVVSGNIDLPVRTINLVVLAEGGVGFGSVGLLAFSLMFRHLS